MPTASNIYRAVLEAPTRFRGRMLELLAVVEAMGHDMEVWQPVLPGSGRGFVILFQGQLRKVEFRVAPPDPEEEYDVIAELDLDRGGIRFHGIDLPERDPVKPNTGIVMRTLARYGRINRGWLQNRTKLTAAELDATITALGDAVRVEIVQDSPKGGRPATYYSLAEGGAAPPSVTSTPPTILAP